MSIYWQVSAVVNLSQREEARRAGRTKILLSFLPFLLLLRPLSSRYPKSNATIVRRSRTYNFVPESVGAVHARFFITEALA